MSKFVQLSPQDYSRSAFDKFSPQRGKFDLDDARAMMWMSQLAYESGDAEQTIKEIGPIWKFASIGILRAQGRGIDSRVIVGERADCTVVAFEGTDPALAANILTDARFGLTTDNVHEGFQAALAAVWPELEF